MKDQGKLAWIIIDRGGDQKTNSHGNLPAMDMSGYS
jgi:hypothetical protein